jgi:hypothetical protein
VPTDRQHGIRQDFDPSHLSPETRTQAAHTFRRGRVLVRFLKGATDRSLSVHRCMRNETDVNWMISEEKGGVPFPYHLSVVNDACTCCLYAAAFLRIADSSKVSILRSSIIRRPPMIVVRTSDALSAYTISA